ncbi:MAG: signal peptidase I [Lachnospiraceae bacterium]|nr:signal peptidase I [Lachnospiraceae bacterium]
MKNRYKGLSFAEKKKIVSGEIIREILVTVFYCFVAVLIAVVLVAAYGMKTTVIGSSMTPGLVNNQTVLINRFAYRLLSPKRGDVVCFYPKGNENSHIYVKRVVGLPGEVIQIMDGYIYIDGVRYNEEENFDIIADPGDASSQFLLGNDEYFVLGDNRNNSEDSRNGNIGAVKKDTIIGKVWFRHSRGESMFGFVK